MMTCPWQQLKLMIPLYLMGQKSGSMVSTVLPQEYMVIAKLLVKAEQVSVTLCTDSLVDEVLTGRTFYSREKGCKLTAVAGGGREGGAAGFYVMSPCSASKTAPSLHLERNIYSFPYRTYPQPTRDISLLLVNVFSE